MRVIGSLAVLVAGMVALSGGVASAQASSVTQEQRVPISGATFVPCANGGLGENIEISGTLHSLMHVTTDDRGGFHVLFHTQLTGLSGTGMLSGDAYRMSALTLDHANLTNGASEMTSVARTRTVGMGSAPTLVLEFTVHFTYNANGTPTAQVVNFGADCG